MIAPEAIQVVRLAKTVRYLPFEENLVTTRSDSEAPVPINHGHEWSRQDSGIADRREAAVAVQTIVVRIGTSL